MATLQKMDILSLGRLKTEAVQVEGGDDIIISELGAADGYTLFINPAYQNSKGELDMATFAPALLSRCIVDADGARIFSDSDEATISRLPSNLFNKLANAAMRLNGLNADSHEAEVKKSPPSPV